MDDKTQIIASARFRIRSKDAFYEFVNWYCREFIINKKTVGAKWEYMQLRTVIPGQVNREMGKKYIKYLLSWDKPVNKFWDESFKDKIILDNAPKKDKE